MTGLPENIYDGIQPGEVQQFFTSGASGVFEALYRQVNNQALAPYLKPCLETDGRILDAGCGWGDLAENLNMAHNCCIDLAFEQLRQGRRRGVIGPCAQSDVTQLPFASETFDAVLCVNVLHYTGFPGFQEIYRVTKPNGRMLLAFLERSDYTRRSIELAMAWGMFPPIMRHVPLFDIADFQKLSVTIEDSVTVVCFPPWFTVSRTASRKGLVVYVLRKPPRYHWPRLQPLCRYRFRTRYRFR